MSSGASQVLLRLALAWQLFWGLAAFVAVGQDKRLAAEHRRRTLEQALHRLEIWGGWLGSLLAQQLFRHKTRMAAYQFVVSRRRGFSPVSA